jgi:hypothetical protein
MVDSFLGDLLPGDVFTGDFFVGDALTGDVFVGDFFVGDFFTTPAVLAAGCLTTVFLTAGFSAAGFFPTVFFAGDFFTAVFFDVVFLIFAPVLSFGLTGSFLSAVWDLAARVGCLRVVASFLGDWGASPPVCSVFMIQGRLLADKGVVCGGASKVCLVI